MNNTHKEGLYRSKREQEEERGGGGLNSKNNRENESSQTNRVVRAVCVGVVPRVQSMLLCAIRAHYGKKFLQDLQNNTTMKRVMVRFRIAREEGAMTLFVECLGVSQEETMEGSLWAETLLRSLGSHNAMELVGGMGHDNGYWHETTRSHAISGTKTGEALSPTTECSTRHWLDPFARVKTVCS